VISDFEAIHFKSEPAQKYRSFVWFLRRQAPNYYPEGGQDAGYAVPDAVRIMTVHQAKGMEFPAVFLPGLDRDRFPPRGRADTMWDHLPKAAVKSAARYDGDIEDERRLLYVAMTRAQKWLFASCAPRSTGSWYRQPSEFLLELTRHSTFLTAEPRATTTAKLVPEPRVPLSNVQLSFSDLKYLLLCPYQFKLRLLYGFNPPIQEALGYGRTIHNALAEVHQRSLDGMAPTVDDAADIVDRHIQVRYAYPELAQQLRDAAVEAVERYLKDHAANLDKLEHVEEPIQLVLPNGVVVSGRIDLIRRTDRDETAIVDFKSSERAQEEDVTRVQLSVYAVGYEQMFGRRADLIEIHNMYKAWQRNPLVAKTLRKSPDLLL
jgi:DNA helicase-2/ATP-dependent DNA helicase PcrA